MTGHTKPRHYFGLILVWKDLARPATLRHRAGHHILNLARLPVPPLSRLPIIREVEGRASARGLYCLGALTPLLDTGRRCCEKADQDVENGDRQSLRAPLSYDRRACFFR